MGHKVLVGFGLFAVFFVFYVGAALMQTPLGKDVAMTQVIGMPLGVIMSLAIFPVSWFLIVLWFWKERQVMDSGLVIGFVGFFVLASMSRPSSRPLLDC